MSNWSAAWLVMLLTIWTSQVWAEQCNQGAFKASTSATAHPEENIECQVLGRAFCMVEEDRMRDRPANYAISRASDWLATLGQTGSHIKTDHRKSVAGIADYLYAHDKMPPWTAYNYAVYTCGLNKRVSADRAKDAALRWDAAAAECLAQFPGEGDGRANQKLKDCLYGAMNAIVGEGKVAKK